MQRRFIATTCQVNEFFPGIALYLIYKTLKIAWLHIQVVSSNRAPRIERLYFSSTNKDCLSTVFGRVAATCEVRGIVTRDCEKQIKV